jgi:hypothetical protein
MAAPLVRAAAVQAPGGVGNARVGA